MPLAGNGLLGLTTAEATRRLAEYGPNVPPQPAPASIGGIILRTLKEPMFFLLMAAAVLYLVITLLSNLVFHGIERRVRRGQKPAH